MKKLFITLIMIVLTSSVIAQGLEANAAYIKKTYPVEYENTIKKHALEKWGTDYEMVVYRINNQADALIELIRNFESDNTDIAANSIYKWSIDGYEQSNMDVFRKINVFGLEQLIPLHCDWEMVKYNYDNQVKAKNSF